MEWAGYVARMEEMRHAYKSVIGKPEGNKSLWRSRRRWEDTVTINLKGTGCELDLSSSG